ncbi:hypothetical protein ADUPG1_000832, partial [Aduncisulcus paluster]
MGSTLGSIQIEKTKYIREGAQYCCPIPRDAPNIKSIDFTSIKALDVTKKEGDKGYDQSSEAQKMMSGENNLGRFTHISIPFSSASPLIGVYICLKGRTFTTPLYLIFTFTSSKGEKISKKYEWDEYSGRHWFFLPADLLD